MLLILDLDETLIHSSKVRLGREPDFKVFDYYIYKRPYLDEFINEVKELYKLAIWSAAVKLYVDEIVSNLFRGEINFEFVWTIDKCAIRYPNAIKELGYYDGGNTFYYMKDLKKVKKAGYNLKSVLILEDQPIKVSQNYGNAIYVNPFEGHPRDKELIYLKEYLKLLNNNNDVRKIEKRDWERKIIDILWNK